MMSEEGFIGRWSRLKQQELELKQELSIEPETSVDVAEQKELIKQLTDEDMPPLDSLDESSDYSMFMSEKVSESLRKEALRKMFHMPSLNIVDGMDDYAEDFSSFDPLQNAMTHNMQRTLKRGMEHDGENTKPAVAEEQGGEADMVQDASGRQSATETVMMPAPGDGEGEDV